MPCSLANDLSVQFAFRISACCNGYSGESKGVVSVLGTLLTESLKTNSVSAESIAKCLKLFDEFHSQ